jgi:hypothetical protein
VAKKERPEDSLGSLRPDLAAAAARLGRRLGDPSELAPVTACLVGRESVAFLAKASYANHAGMLLLTDARLLFFYSGVRPPGLDLPLGAVTSVTTSSGLSTGVVTLVVAGQERPLLVERIVKADLEPLAHAIRRAAEAAPAPAPTSTSGVVDPFVAMERLAALRDSGVLTEEEFSAKKQELLDRL